MITIGFSKPWKTTTITVTVKHLLDFRGMNRPAYLSIVEELFN
jgi:hypothetical protein